MTIIESEMGVVAGISFGVACFQVSSLFFVKCLVLVDIRGRFFLGGLFL